LLTCAACSIRSRTSTAESLKIRHVAYVPGRGNLIVEYPGTTDKMVSFVGSHLDVVPADPTKWSVDPFKLTRDGDKLYGRGATDCLGHVALITDLLAALATKKPALKVGITVVFIASEENSSVPGVGVDVLEKNGLLKPMQEWSCLLGRLRRFQALCCQLHAFGSPALTHYNLTDDDLLHRVLAVFKLGLSRQPVSQKKYSPRMLFTEPFFVFVLQANCFTVAFRKRRSIRLSSPWMRSMRSRRASTKTFRRIRPRRPTTLARRRR
jgi:hypothetical protein